MQLLSPSTRASLVFHSGPFTLAHDGETGAVDDKMKRSLGRNTTECEVELLTPPRQGGVIRGIEIDSHRRQHGPQEVLGLAQRQPEDQPQRQRGHDRHVRELPRPTRSARRRRSPRNHCLGREPERHVAPSDQPLLIFRPIPDVILGLVLRMNLRLHREIVGQGASTRPPDRRPWHAPRPGNPVPTPRIGGPDPGGGNSRAPTPKTPPTRLSDRLRSARACPRRAWRANVCLAARSNGDFHLAVERRRDRQERA